MATKIDTRFVFTSGFFNESLKDNFDLQYKLSYITSKATGNKKKQNTISSKTREQILIDNPKLSLEVLRYFLNKIDLPLPIEEIEDEETRTIKMAIYLTYETIYTKPTTSITIFVSKSKSNSYKGNPHYQHHKRLTFISGEEAIDLINYWFKICREERISSC